MKIAGLVILVALLVGVGWWLHHTGYESGVAEQAEVVRGLKSDLSKLEKELAKGIAQAKQDAKDRKAEAREKVEELQVKNAEITSSLDVWMSKYHEAVKSCAIAKKPLCPSLQRY